MKTIEAYIHPPVDAGTQEPDAWVNLGGKNWRSRPCYYASVKRDSQVALAAGPFKTHPEALAQVSPVRAFCREHDPRSAFDAFGTVKMKTGERDGKLNIPLKIEVPHA